MTPLPEDAEIVRGGKPALPRWFIATLALAVLLGMVLPALAADITVKGKIKNVAADKQEFSLTDQDGKELKFQVDNNAKVHLNNKESKLLDLKAGDQVEVKYEKQGERMIAKEIHCDRK